MPLLTLFQLTLKPVLEDLEVCCIARLIGYGADDGLEGAEDAAEGEGDEHGEEEGRPEVGGRHPCQHLGVHDEGEAGSSAKYLNIQFLLTTNQWATIYRVMLLFDLELKFPPVCTFALYT